MECARLQAQSGQRRAELWRLQVPVQDAARGGISGRGDRPGKNAAICSPTEAWSSERMSGLEAPRAGKSGMFLRALPRRKRTRRGRRCEISQNSYRQPDSRHAQKRREEMGPPRLHTFGVRVSDPAYHCLRALFPPGNLCAGPEVQCRKHGLAAKTYPGVLARYSPRNIRKGMKTFS